ncbi:MAG: carbon-nitrogen hydrolase family protein [Desulfobacteraceae bacterium]|nr:carbon-nitrogen hydrolase family protein [Desulfobacteraceae bacterium]
MLIEKNFSDNSDNISVGIANISSKTKNLEENKKQIIKALNLFSEKKANLVIFPECCLTGYFWEHEKDCRTYMEKNSLDNLTDWIDIIVKSYVNETLQYIVFNGLIKNSVDTKKFFNISFVLDQTGTYFDKDRTYKKTFLPKLEKKYLLSGINDTLVLKTAWGKFGFLTCYDICFPKLIQKLVKKEKVDGLIVNAAWRKQGEREYKGPEIKEDAYYKYLWDLILPTLAFQNRVWVMAANAVGPHSIAGVEYCGGSGIWAPSGINILKGSNTKEELLILHNIDMIRELKAERNNNE